MRTDEKIGYMIGCLQVVKDEMDHKSEHLMMKTESRDSMEKREKYWEYIERTGVPNKSLERCTRHERVYEMHGINGKTTAKRNRVAGNNSTRQDWGM